VSYQSSRGFLYSSFIAILIVAIAVQAKAQTNPAGPRDIIDHPFLTQATALAGTSADPQPLIFLPALDYSSGGLFAQAVIVADLNGDGKLDIVVSNYYTLNFPAQGSVAVLLGNGDATFRAPLLYPAGGDGSNGLALADFNGDGKLDIAVGNYVAGSIGLLLGNGDGTFQPVATFPIKGVGNVWSLVGGDLNGDGKMDLLVGSFYSGTVGVLMGNGDGTFHSKVDYNSGGPQVASITVADVNHDGKLDLLLPGSTGVGVLLGKGDGTFQPVVTYGSPGKQVGRITAIDLNGDGNLDLAVAGSGAGVLLGNGDGTFQPEITYSSVPEMMVAAADINGDGKLDLVALENTNAFVLPTTLSVLLGNGDGTFQPPVPYDSGGAFPFALAIADFNNDGKPDMLVTNQCVATSCHPAGGTLGLLLNNYGAPPTTTSVVSSKNPQELYRPVTYTASVTAASAGTLTGSVVFQDGGTNIAIVPLVSNRALYTSYYQKIISHSITARYSGELNQSAGSISASLTQSIVGASTTMLTTSNSPSLVGQPVTFTATVTSKYGAIPDGELVTFYDSLKVLASVPLLGGKATYNTSSMSPRTHSLKATYAGDNSHLRSTGFVQEIVNRYSTHTTLAATPNPSKYSSPVTLTAKVTGTSSTPLSGKVIFHNGAAWFAAASVNADGVATVIRTTLPLGSNSLTATYNGDAVNDLSSSPPVIHVVQ